MDSQQPNEPRGPAMPPLGVVPVESTAPQDPKTVRKATASLILAGLALASMTITAPLALFAMLATYPSNGPSEAPWVAPLVFFSLPLLFSLPSLALSIPIMYCQPRATPGRRMAAVALCTAGLVVGLALGPGLDQLGKL
ncbi:hypothetical protein [Pseudarthrobacter phenanthrenivorans]|nr:hypothetical protein [Pseudarthrobacter phenanthrenivorans]